MTYQLATLTKEAITANTGMLARVCIKNGEFEAAPVLPGKPAQLSTIQRSALYVAYIKANANDSSITIGAALQSGVFDSRAQCIAVYDTLAAFGWVKSYEGRITLTSKGADFVKAYMYSKSTYAKQAIADEAVVDLGKSGEVN